jgi:hypothetical protein
VLGYTFVILALRRLRQEDHEFEALSQKKQKKKEKQTKLSGEQSTRLLQKAQ